MGLILLLCGLAAKEPGEHGLAADIAIQAVNDGRLGTDNFAHMLETGVNSGHFNLTRLAKRLEDVAAASSLHAYVMIAAAEQALPSADAKQLPRGIGDIFELLAETATQLDRGIEDADCRSMLQNITGSNKTAKSRSTIADGRFELRSASDYRIGSGSPDRSTPRMGETTIIRRL